MLIKVLDVEYTKSEEIIVTVNDTILKHSGGKNYLMFGKWSWSLDLDPDTKKLKKIIGERTDFKPTCNDSTQLVYTEAKCAKTAIDDDKPIMNIARDCYNYDFKYEGVTFYVRDNCGVEWYDYDPDRQCSVRVLLIKSLVTDHIYGVEWEINE